MVLTHEVKPADLTNTGVASTAHSSRARTAPVNPSGTQTSGGTQGKKQSPGDIADQRKKEYNDSMKKTGSKWTPVQGPGCLPKPSNKTTLGQSGRSMCPQLELEVGGSLCR
jgi:hypothetical protein